MGFPTAGGALTIVACCISFVIGILALIEISYHDYFYYYSGYAIAGILNVIGFAFGITAGVLTLKRRIFPLAIAGASLVLVSSAIITAVFTPFGGFAFGVSAFVLSILGVIFTAVSKSEFT
jgi:hypothetical protein